MSKTARLVVPDRDLSAAHMKVMRAAWASKYFREFDRDSVLRIAEAVTQAGHEKAAYFAEKAVTETGYGIAEHKAIKNKLCTYDLLNYYRDLDLIQPRVDAERMIIEVPKPAGVVFALAPVTNPVATIYYKSLLAILSRNAMVFTPHPAAKSCSAEAVAVLAEAAEAAGAPSGLLQCIENPSIPVINDIMQSDKIDVIMATGGSAMVRAAYSSGNPALGVGSGNAVAYVDPSARVDQAAKHLVESKSFDNSILCTNESICLTLESNFANMQRALRTAGAYVCNAEETDKIRSYLWQDRHFNLDAVGKSASWIAEQAGIKNHSKAKILVPVVEKPGQDDLLFREKLCPVLTLTAAVDFKQALSFSRTMLKRGAGHSAAFHGENHDHLVAFTQTVPVYRVVVNAPCSQGAAGFATHLPPSFMIGTGYAGRSSVAENVGPQHLVHWSKIAFGRDQRVDIQNINFSRNSDSMQQTKAATASVAAPIIPSLPESGLDRDQLRQMILEELRGLKGSDV